VRKISNPGMIKRNKQIGKYGTLAAMVVLVGGIIISNMYKDRLDLSYGALILGSILMLIGSLFTTRWGRNPPPDQAVDDVLKGLDDRYTLIHYRLGAEHALFTPDGILALLAKSEGGQVSYDGKKWRQTGVSGLGKFFGTESLGNPSSDSLFEVESLTRTLRRILGKGETFIIRPIIIFTNDKTRVDADASTVPALHASKVKEYIRHMPKETPLRPDQLQQVIEYAGGKK
jgi:hypothetical protein